MVKNLAGLQETQETRVSSLGQEDPLEKEMETQSSIVAWEILWTEEPDALWSKCCKESDITRRLNKSLPKKRSMFESRLRFLALQAERETLQNLTHPRLPRDDFCQH